MDRLQTIQLTTGYHSAKEEIRLHQDLGLSLHPGEMVALIGPNGSGKTTLLKTLSGLLRPLHGQLLINGSHIDQLSPLDKSRLIAVVLTETIQQPFFSVRALVGLGRYPYNDWLARESEEDKRIVADAIKKCNLGHLAEKYLDSLSDGERQRAMIARAIAQQTPVMILDEPTAHLDLKSRVEVLLLLRKIARATGTAVIVATHELELAIHLADRLWVMPEKGLFMEGIPEDLVLRDVFGKTFNSGEVQFDSFSGRFVIRNEHTKSVAVAGAGLRHYWTVRALERKGFAIDDRASQRVSVLEQGWEYNGQAADSIEKLLVLVEAQL